MPRPKGPAKRAVWVYEDDALHLAARFPGVPAAEAFHRALVAEPSIDVAAVAPAPPEPVLVDPGVAVGARPAAVTTNGHGLGAVVVEEQRALDASTSTGRCVCKRPVLSRYSTGICTACNRPR